MVQKNSVKKPKVVVVVGATASGKTSVGVKLAKLFNGEVVSCDSMQIYKHMDVGTAKVTPEEMSGVPHHLINIVNPTDSYSVANWVEDATKVIKEIIAKGKTPIIVGGTGLYVTSLLNGYTFYSTPQTDAIRENYRKILSEQGVDTLYNILKQKAPQKANMIDKHKTKAVIRALEIIDTNSSSNAGKQEPPYEYLLIGLNHDRQFLYDRINKRVDIMINNGLLNEFEVLQQKYGLQRSHQSAGAIGYKELFDYKEGLVDLDTTINLIKQHSRNYAKRQLTWFRRMENIIWLSPVNEMESIEKLVSKFIKE